MPGLIQNELDDDLLKMENAPDAGQVATAGSVGYDPATRTVDAGKETVSGQLDAVLAKDSVLMQRARAGATQAANKRGLLNSSMAAGAGEAAVIDAALPIANADANIYGTASRDNQAATNQSRQFGASESNTTARLNAGAMNQAGQAKLAAQLEQGLIGTRTDAQSRLQAEGGEQQRLTQAAGGEIQSRLQSESATQRGVLSAQEAMQQSGLSAQQAAQQSALAQVQGEIEKGLIATREQADARLRELAGQIETALVGTRAGAESTLQAERAAQEKEITALRAQLETQLQTLRGDQATQLGQIEAGYRQLIQANASASSFYAENVRMMAAIMSDVNTSTEQKQAAVDRLGSMLKSGLTVIGGIANIDIAGLLDFTAPEGA